MPYRNASDSEIVFSIFVITYNHEQYVKKALDSILQQEFPLKKEIVIGIDKSTDNTIEVCKEYKNLYPEENIVLLERTENIGMYQNFYDTLFACKGRYIAILEGDDYWTDTKKLWKQYEKFEKHPTCILSGSSALVVNENDEIIETPIVKNSGRGIKYYKEDLILANRFTALTVAFRCSRIDWKKLSALKQSPHLDWPFYLSLQYEDKDYCYKFDDIFGAYRQHNGGVYSMIDNEKKILNTAKTVFAINKINNQEYQRIYLKYLFANLLKDKGEIANSFAGNFFDPSLIIYKKRWIKSDFLGKISLDALRYLIYGRKSNFSFKSKLELIRQTKYSKKNYLQLAVNPFVIFGWLKIYLKRIFLNAIY